MRYYLALAVLIAAILLCIWIFILGNDINLGVITIGKTDEGYFNEALNKREPRLCEKIRDESMQYSCLSGIALNTRDAEVCSRILNQEEKDYCIYQVAISTRNLQLCEEILYVDIHEQCRAFFR